MVKYPNTSPYAFTPVYNNSFLDLMENREIPPSIDDEEWEINQTYHLRPDLLAFDLYDDSKLWWVFAQRNPNRLKDPIFDFTMGTKIFVPKIENIKTALGL
jgi:hypothetical protein